MFLLSNTLSFCLLPSLASFFLSRSLALSHSLPVATPRARAKQEASTRSGIHCVSMTRFITAGTLHVSEALLDPESRGWMPFWLKRLLSPPPHPRPPPPFISTCASKSTSMCLFALVPPQKAPMAPPQSLPLVTRWRRPLRLPVSVPALLICQLRPELEVRGPVLLLTGVICASSIDVVCQPIKIFEGNVYFLERIAPAAWKLFLNKAIYAQEFAIVRRSARTSW